MSCSLSSSGPPGEWARQAVWGFCFIAHITTPPGFCPYRWLRPKTGRAMVSRLLAWPVFYPENRKASLHLNKPLTPGHQWEERRKMVRKIKVRVATASEPPDQSRQLSGSCEPCHKCLTPLQSCKSSHRECIHKWVWLYPNKTSFTKRWLPGFCPQGYNLPLTELDKWAQKQDLTLSLNFATPDITTWVGLSCLLNTSQQMGAFKSCFLKQAICTNWAHSCNQHPDCKTQNSSPFPPKFPIRTSGPVLVVVSSHNTLSSTTRWWFIV